MSYTTVMVIIIILIYPIVAVPLWIIDRVRLKHWKRKE